VHAIVAQILLDWCATATGQTRSDVIQRLALLNAWLASEPGRFPKALQTGIRGLKPASTARHGAARQPVAGSCRADLGRI
jgi:hypothetical protein